MMFRRKPTEVEAIQWTGDNLSEVKAFVGLGVLYRDDPYGKGDVLVIDTEPGQPNRLGGDRARARAGDWILKDSRGAFYPCDREVFENSYERVDRDW